MSRSRRKNPCGGITASPSEKNDKQIANRRLRKINKQILQSTMDGDALRDINEVSNPWNMAKDGKMWFGEWLDDEDMGDEEWKLMGK